MMNQIEQLFAILNERVDHLEFMTLINALIGIINMLILLSAYTMLE